jgi:hypothetical protein
VLLLPKTHIAFLIILSLLTINSIHSLATNPDLTDIKLGVTFLTLEVLAYAVIINIIFGGRIKKNIIDPICKSRRQKEKQ